MNGFPDHLIEYMTQFFDDATLTSFLVGSKRFYNMIPMLWKNRFEGSVSLLWFNWRLEIWPSSMIREQDEEDFLNDFALNNMAFRKIVNWFVYWFKAFRSPLPLRYHWFYNRFKKMSAWMLAYASAYNSNSPHDKIFHQLWMILYKTHPFLYIPQKYTDIYIWETGFALRKMKLSITITNEKCIQSIFSFLYYILTSKLNK